MKIALKELFCIEWEFDREIVLDAEHSFSVTAYIGPDKSEKADGFTVTVCNCDFIKGEIKRNGYFSSSWYLVLDNPTRENIENYFIEKIGQLSGGNWDDYYQKLRLIGKSEFEDYKNL
jgi:hypothetical protein